jgi:hypothetical protein
MLSVKFEQQTFYEPLIAPGTAYSADVLDPATCAMILASSAGDAIDVFRE